VSFASTGSPTTALNRAYQHVDHADNSTFSDRHSPSQVGLGPVQLDTAAQGVWVRSVRGHTGVVAELNHPMNHPFRTYDTCEPVWTLDLESQRSPGIPGIQKLTSTLAARSTLVLSEQPAPSPRRFPHGFQAAIAFTDHADMSNAARLDALMWGGGAASGPRGFAGRQLGMTKTVFHRQVSPYAPQLDDPAYEGLVRGLLSSPVKLGLHSPSGETDTPEQVADAVAAITSLGGRVWIDHQPATNCEALVNRGLDPTSDDYIGDILMAGGIDTVWSSDDQPASGLDLFRSDLPEQRVAVVWQRAGFRWFTSTWAARPTEDLLRMFTPDELDKLEAAHGLHIAHTYLDGHSTGHRAAWSVLEPVADGYRLSDDFDDLLAELQRRQQAGRIWVSDIASVVDHLVAVDQILTVPISETVARVYNPSSTPVRGLTLWFPSVPGWPVVDGERLPQSQVRETSGGLWFWFDMEDQSLVYFLDDSGRPVTLWPAVNMEAP